LLRDIANLASLILFYLTRIKGEKAFKSEKVKRWLTPFKGEKVKR